MAVAGRLAFVTGAGSGIGRAVCQILAKEGATIIVTDKKTNDVEETIASINYTKNNHTGFTLDVSRSEAVKKTLDQIIKKYSRPPTIIINSAGITKDNFLVKLSEQDFENVINVNLKGTFFVVQTFANAIIDHGITNASIINIGSIVGKYGNIGQANYSASKAGVTLLTKTASKELGKKGIRVNTVLPGMIYTPMLQAVPDKVQEKFKQNIPLGRFGTPEEVAEVITFLASDKSSYITGASIDITGGF